DGSRTVSIWDNLGVSGTVTTQSLRVNGAAYGQLFVYGGRFAAGWNGPPNFWANADGVLHYVRGYSPNDWAWWHPETEPARPRAWYKIANDPTGNSDALLHHYRRDVNFSDVRLKKDIRPISGALDKLSHLQGAVFRWNETGIKHFTDDIPDLVTAD